MATAQLQKPKEKTGTWSAIFPNEQITETQSALFVKKLLAVAVSNIAYLRAIFPEHSFGDRSLEGLNLKILREDIACPGACQVIKWVKGCFEAFDKKYLRALMIGLYVDPDDPDTVIESYTFRFSYTDQGGIDIYRNNEKISGAHSESETRKATIRLLRTIIILTQTLEALPDNVLMTMKLLYYDDVTPEDYEPTGFRSADSDNFSFYDEPTTIKVGDVATPFHCVKVRVKTGRKQFEMADEAKAKDSQQEAENNEINSGLDNASMDDSEEKEAESFQEEQVAVPSSGEATEARKRPIEPQADAEVPQESPAKPGVDDNAVEIKIGSQASQISDSQEFAVRCPCGCNSDDGLMIMCADCKFWQHGVCFLVMEEDEAPDEHLCDVCALKNRNMEPTDPYLLDLSTIEVQATCLWRRALIACLDMSRVLAPVLAKRLGTEMTVAQGLMNRLNKEGFLKTQGKGKRLGKLVDKTKITTVGIPKYMQKTEWAGVPAEVPDQTTEMTEQQTGQQSSISKQDEMEVTKDEIEAITEKTEELKINNGRQKLSRKKKKLLKQNCSELMRVSPEAIKEQTEAMPVEPQQTTVPEPEIIETEIKRKGRKRAISKANDEYEFEVSCTQDVYDEQVPKRKKKASVVEKDIMV